MNKNRIVKKFTYKGSIKDAPSDYQYWIKKTEDERISAVEILREQYYGKITPRLQRVYKIVKRNQS